MAPSRTTLLRGIVVALACGLAWPAAPATAAHKKAVATTTKAKSRKNPATRRPIDSAPAIDVGNPREAQVEQSAERDRLTARIAELKQQIAAGERSRSGAAAALQRAERALGEVNRRLDELARRQRESEERIAGLERQRAGTEGQIAARQTSFGRTAVLLDANSERDAVRAYEAGEDPLAPTLDETYLLYAARAQAADVDALHGRARDLQAQKQRADDDARALLAQAEAQKSARETLAADQAAQKKTLTQLSQQLAEQRSTAAALAADEKRLSRIVEQLQRAIERRAADERARRMAAEERARRQAELAAKHARATKPPDARPRETEPPPVVVESVPDEGTAHGAFAQLRGQLRLPVRGTIAGRFGAPRGGSGATWKGVFVRTDSGAEVHAVAGGKVVFADDLRGFGNLLIIDHGDQYLSIYGNNQTLLKRAGETVRPGDVVARAGSSIGDDQTGLYFELRHGGRPFDPLSWTGGR